MGIHPADKVAQQHRLPPGQGGGDDLLGPMAEGALGLTDRRAAVELLEDEGLDLLGLAGDHRHILCTR